VKLRHLEEWIVRRQRTAALYDELLAGLPVSTPRTAPDNTHVFYLYPIRCEQRDALMATLTEHGIGTQVIYPTLVPFQEAYRPLGYRAGQFPVAEAAAREILCPPMFPELTEGEVRTVAGAIQAFYRG
jgi:dTDP-4-amino-4,6-dideoxygalactose transaminase